MQCNAGVPGYPTRPSVAPEGNGPTHITVRWELGKGDAKQGVAKKELPLEWQVMYGHRVKGKWSMATWDGNRDGNVEVLRDKNEKPCGERRWWSCQIDGLEPGEL
eukprot:SAG22_NODE_1759_length_3637_cov_2.968061_2_plen_105_part_00